MEEEQEQKWNFFIMTLFEEKVRIFVVKIYGIIIFFSFYIQLLNFIFSNLS